MISKPNDKSISDPDVEICDRAIGIFLKTGDGVELNYQPADRSAIPALLQKALTTCPKAPVAIQVERGVSVALMVEAVDAAYRLGLDATRVSVAPARGHTR